LRPEAIRRLTDAQLQTLHVNCLAKLGDGRLGNRAETMLAVIHDEFRLRHLKATNESFVPMLACVGYNVRYGDLTETARRNLLDLIIRSTLPQINSPDYMQEWAEPGSMERCRNLWRTIKLYRDRYGGKDSTELAVERWEDDLAYVESIAERLKKNLSSK
jgi:hypothetical protein